MRKFIFASSTMALGFSLAIAASPAAAQTNPAPGNAGSSPAGMSDANKPSGTSDANKPSGMQSVQTSTMTLRFITVQPAEPLSSRLVGSNVYNNQNETIGEIEDLVIENGRKIKAVVIGIGGFLGLGERYVAVDPGTLTLLRQGDNMRVTANATKEELKNAPTFDYSKKR